jgi:hypothetical protein
LVADRHHGIERGHRLLKDHGDLAAALTPESLHRLLKKVGCA